MNILFMGTPDFASLCLEQVANAYSNENKISVVTSPDKPRGRSLKMSFSAVKESAIKLGLDVYQPENLKKENFLQLLCQLNPDIIVVAAYGKILPEYVLNYPKYGCINVHASLLPEYRGAAPINRCIIDGKKETGITIMKMEKGLDTGDILLVEKTPIGDNENVGDLFDRLCDIGARLCVTAIDKAFKGELVATKQDSALATYAEKIDSYTQKINFSQSAESIRNLIRGLSPYPAALTKHEKSGKIIKVFSARASDQNYPDAKDGQIVSLNKEIAVSCREGVLLIDQLAMEGSRRMSAVDFINGRKVEKGDVFI